MVTIVLTATTTPSTIATMTTISTMTIAVATMPISIATMPISIATMPITITTMMTFIATMTTTTTAMIAATPTSHRAVTAFLTLAPTDFGKVIGLAALGALLTLRWAFATLRLVRQIETTVSARHVLANGVDACCADAGNCTHVRVHILV
jgi:hypothetical protein